MYMFDNIIVYSLAAVFMYAVGRVLIETLVAEWGLIPTILFGVVCLFIGYIQYRIDNY